MERFEWCCTSSSLLIGRLDQCSWFIHGYAWIHIADELNSVVKIFFLSFLWAMASCLGLPILLPILDWELLDLTSLPYLQTKSFSLHQASRITTAAIVALISEPEILNDKTGALTTVLPTVKTLIRSLFFNVRYQFGRIVKFNYANVSFCVLVPSPNLVEMWRFEDFFSFCLK